MTIQELRKLGEEATAGPWRTFDQHDTVAVLGPTKRGLLGGAKEVVHWAGFDSSDYRKDSTNNAVFIATARNNWELLLDVAEAAEALIAQPLDVRIVKEDEPSMDAFSAKRDAVVLALRALETTK